MANVVMRLTNVGHEQDPYEMLERSFSKISVHAEHICSSTMAVDDLKNRATDCANCGPKSIMLELLEGWILLAYLKRLENGGQRGKVEDVIPAPTDKPST